jgi:capsid protein
MKTPRKSKNKPARRTSRAVQKTQPTTIMVVRRGDLRAGYDAAKTTDDNRRHWANTDTLGPNSALDPETRRILRSRSRYEVCNNPYAKGIGLTIANDTVGTGPTLQMTSGDSELESSADSIVETLFWNWMLDVGLAQKLRLMRFARYDSGEAFAIFVNNPGLRGPVKLDVQIIEAEQIASPVMMMDPFDTDGINYDDSGNPIAYHKLRVHPGETFSLAMFPSEGDWIPARSVYHYFRADRPGQLRGIPDITPAITVFADLRRFTQATIAAAETAADFAAVVKTDAPGNEDDAAGTVGETPVAWDLVNLEKRGALVLPQNFDITQLKAEHPSTTYREFVGAKLNEVARCLCVPFHIAAMDPSLANMSSSYVVGQMYAQERIVDRSCLECFLNKCREMWLEEARLIPNFLPEMPENPYFSWFWPSLGHHADPQKVANAAATELANGLTTFPKEYAKRGDDWEEQQQLAAKSLGVTLDQYRELLRNKIFGAAPAPNGPAPSQETQNVQQGTPSQQNGNGNGHAVHRR